jgi:hypothetical protein
MVIKSTGLGRVCVRGHFLVTYGNKTHGFRSGLGFAPMTVRARPFFPLRVYPNLICLFLTYFYKSDDHMNSDGCKCNFSSDSISLRVRFLSTWPKPNPLPSQVRQDYKPRKKRAKSTLLCPCLGKVHITLKLRYDLLYPQSLLNWFTFHLFLFNPMWFANVNSS